VILTKRNSRFKYIHEMNYTYIHTCIHAYIQINKYGTGAEDFFWWVLQHCTGFARLVWGRLRVHLSFHLFKVICVFCVFLFSTPASHSPLVLLGHYGTGAEDSGRVTVTWWRRPTKEPRIGPIRDEFPIRDELGLRHPVIVEVYFVILTVSLHRSFSADEPYN